MLMLRITEKITIPADELVFEAMRSSGPGGQNVNKVSTCVRLSFDLSQTECFDQYQMHRIHSKLHKRISKAGILSVTCQSERSQIANKQIAMEQLRELLEGALRRPKFRKPTRVSKGKLEKRKVEKQQHKQKKRSRGNVKSF